MNNPFKYGKEVTGEQFYDRTESVEELHQLLKDGVANVVLYAPRRYGKTSLVVKVLQRFQAEEVSCVHFDVSKVSAFVVSRFAAEGVAVRPEALARIMDAACDIPYCVQAVSAYTFMSVERRKATEATAEDVEVAIGRLLDAEADYYEEILQGLSVAQRNVLEALAAEPSARFDEGYRRRHALTNLSTVHSSLGELVGRGLVEKDKTGYSLGDPIFVRYLTCTAAATVYS